MPRHHAVNCAVTIVVIILLILLTGQSFANEKPGESSGFEKNEDQEKTDIPFRQETLLTGGLLVKMLFGFIVVIGVAVLVLYLLKKHYFGQASIIDSGKKHITYLESKRLSPKLNLFLVDVEGEKILLAQSGDQIAFYDKSIRHKPDINDHSIESAKD